MKIAVLLGGTSSERDVSLVSGIAIARALKENGHEVIALDCAFGAKEVDIDSLDSHGIIQLTPSDIEKQRQTLDRNIFQTIDFLLKHPVDVVFNALHGGYGENGQLATLLDLANITYTGSGALASALGMNKHLSKILFRAHGVPTADWIILNTPQEYQGANIAELGFPLVVKPNDQGSTVGLSIVENKDDIEPALEIAFNYSDTVIMEKYIPGKEVTVSILGNQALPVIEIIPESGLYDYEAKYQTGKTRYEVPANIPDEITQSLQNAALSAARALGCRGYSRVDFRLQEDGAFYCLEVNTLPGMTPTSLVPKAAKAVGISFNELVEKIIQLALR
ncbi:MAG: D-alanine--D-alanine ligase [Calditrichaeota bacterium]|nr:MAG: D-alanine--D-alanine ligase [Calditrichota bacterium]